MKRGKLSSEDREFIERYSDKDPEFIAKKIDRSVDFVEKILAEHQSSVQEVENQTTTKGNRHLMGHKTVDGNEGVSIMTPAMSARTDEANKKRKRYSVDPNAIFKPLGDKK